MVRFLHALLGRVFMFSAAYEVTGGQFSEKEYPGMPKVFYYFIATFRTSMGDIQTIEYKKYLMDRKEEGNEARIYFLIGALWMIWIVNQFLVQIILLNFIIAIISQNYEEVINNEEQF